MSNPRHPLLNTYSLHGKYTGFWSVNISGNVRLLFRYRNDKSAITLMDIGTHSQLYG